MTTLQVSGQQKSQETLAEHAELRIAMDRLRVIAGASMDVIPADRLQILLGHDLNEFALRVQAHFSSEERGCYLGIEGSPELSGRLGVLRSQHEGLRVRLRGLLEEIEATPPRVDFGDRLVGLLNDLFHHERSENEVLQESMLRDTGRGA
jgi:hypothetical protein